MKVKRQQGRTEPQAEEDEDEEEDDIEERKNTNNESGSCSNSLKVQACVLKAFFYLVG